MKSEIMPMLSYFIESPFQATQRVTVLATCLAAGLVMRLTARFASNLKRFLLHKSGG